jgi:hypothetical protein
MAPLEQLAEKMGSMRVRIFRHHVDVHSSFCNCLSRRGYLLLLPLLLQQQQQQLLLLFLFLR